MFELVLVLLIIGTLMAVVVPSLGRLGRHRIDHAATLLLSLLHEARTRAITEARPYRLVVDRDHGICWLTAQTPEGFVRPPAAHGRVHTLDRHLIIEWEGSTDPIGELTIQFEPDGRAQVGQILVSDEHNEAVAVYCQTPAEPYRVGKPLPLHKIDAGGVDVAD